MDDISNFFGLGLKHYSDALFAVTRFEEVLASEIEAAMTTDVKTGIQGLFGVNSISGGGFTAFRPTIAQICDLSPENYWAFPSRQYWIEGHGTLFVGLLIENAKPFAAVSFGGFRQAERETILDALRSAGIDPKWVKDAGEVQAKRPITFDMLAGGFRSELSELMECITIVLRKKGPFITK